MNRRDLLTSFASATAGAGILAADPDAAWSNAAHASRAESSKPAGSSFFSAKDGASLFYYDWGTGKPIVFTHGWAIGADCWEYQLTPLSDQGFRCIAHDRRGCGRSSQPSSGYDFDTFADDLAALLEHLNLRDAVLVGHSMGCSEIARYLTRHGAGRISRVVLISTTTPCLYKSADNPEGFDRDFFNKNLADLIKDRPRYLTAGARLFFGEGSDVSPELTQWAINLALRASLKASIEMVRARDASDFRPDMKSFTVPTLLIHGDADVGAPLALTSQKTAQLIKGSQLKIYKGASHGLMITHKDQLNADIVEFARS
jgi:pimeloyl-ACP methyl ester carboxylesterase